MKKIVIISEGDANNPKTWSNIPYFLMKSLENDGNKVYTIDVGPNKYINYFFNKIIYPFIQLIDGKDSEYKFNRTVIYDKYCKYKIRKSLKKIGNIDVTISTSYSFAPVIHKNYKIILLCDWTFEYHIENYKKREPTNLELKAIRRQEEVINSANVVISLFPNIAKIMNQKYANVKYIGNVINIDDNLKINLDYKYNSNSILFIGGKRYVEGAKTLIKSVQYLNEEKHMNLNLNIIGLNENDLNINKKDYINYYGYLNKINGSDHDIYYKLIKNAKICINTTPIWAGFSSIIEAMFLYTPIITSKYESFENTFGKKFDSNFYSDNNYITLSEKIMMIANLNKALYFDLCKEMKNMVSDMTWSQYVKRLENEFK